MENEKLFTFLRKFLDKEGIYVDHQELKFQLLSHPYYPSLNAIVGTLNHFNVKNYPIQIDESEENLNNLPDNFLTRTTENDAFVLVTKKNNTIKFAYEDLKQKTLSASEFVKIWDGKVLIVEAIERAYIRKPNKKYLSIAASLGFFIIICLSAWSLDDNVEHLNFILGIIGCIIGGLIINKQFGGGFSILDKVCNLTSQTDCNKVLESKEIKLPFGAELGDLAIVYFTSTSIFWMLSPHIGLDTSILFYLSVLSIPITLVSLYYQQFVIKAWCTLCLALVGILWFQFGLYMFNGLAVFSKAPELISAVAILFISLQTYLLWSIGKKYILKQKELEIAKIRYSKFKSNFKLFQLALASSPPIPSFSSLEKANEIRIGNTDAKTQVTMITNPTCGFCKDAYEILKQGIDRFPENYGLTMRFSVDTKNTQSLGYRVALRLVMLYQVSSNLDIKSTLNILSKDKTALEKWLKDNNFNADSNLYVSSAEKLLIEEKEWCVNNGVFFTPFILINNIPFPEQYDISDLPLVLSDLVDYYDGELQIAV